MCEWTIWLSEDLSTFRPPARRPGRSDRHTLSALISKVAWRAKAWQVSVLANNAFGKPYTTSHPIKVPSKFKVSLAHGWCPAHRLPDRESLQGFRMLWVDSVKGALRGGTSSCNLQQSLL